MSEPIVPGPDESSHEWPSHLAPLAMATLLCDERGVKLTTARRQVLELLWETGCPTGAYELMETLQQRNARPVNPPTVYRALKFLITQGFVHKLESRNAYVVCIHPERHHACIFFICADCGVSTELEDERVAGLIDEAADDRLGFHVTGRVVEVKGTCRQCTPAEP